MASWLLRLHRLFLLGTREYLIPHPISSLLVTLYSVASASGSPMVNRINGTHTLDTANGDASDGFPRLDCDMLPGNASRRKSPRFPRMSDNLTWSFCVNVSAQNNEGF